MARTHSDVAIRLARHHADIAAGGEGQATEAQVLSEFNSRYSALVAAEDAAGLDTLLREDEDLLQRDFKATMDACVAAGLSIEDAFRAGSRCSRHEDLSAIVTVP